MNNYVIIDTNIGCIQWVGQAATPLEAVTNFDNELGWSDDAGLEEVEFPRGERLSDELIVYQAPNGWDCDDGGKQDKIDEAESFPIAGIFEVKAEEDTE